MTDPLSHPFGILNPEERNMAKNNSGGTWRSQSVSRTRVTSVMKKAAAREGQFVRSPSSGIKTNGSTAKVTKKH